MATTRSRRASDASTLDFEEARSSLHSRESSRDRTWSPAIDTSSRVPLNKTWSHAEASPPTPPDRWRSHLRNSMPRTPPERIRSLMRESIHRPPAERIRSLISDIMPRPSTDRAEEEEAPQQVPDKHKEEEAVRNLSIFIASILRSTTLLDTPLTNRRASGKKTLNNGEARPLLHHDLDLPSIDITPRSSMDEAERDIEKQEQNNDQDEEEGDPNIVDWSGPEDPENPMNWTLTRKWLITLILGMMTFTVTFASSVFSTAIKPTSEEFGRDTEVMTFGVSLFVLGFAFGPICWGPLSELYGRKNPLFIPYLLFAIFQVPVAVAQNVETIMLCRFLGGFFASGPLAIVGGELADIFNPVDRGVAIVVFACASFIGPVMGPILGGFITQSYLGWRWTAWITLIMAALFGIIGFFIIPESAAPVVLQRRARKIRFETQNWAIHAKLDEKKVDLRDIAERYLLKPFRMLILEPILFLITLYMGLIYGIVYLLFVALPISFQEQRGYNEGVGALPFLGVLIGVIIGGIIIAWMTKGRYARKLRETGKPVPEERLPPMIIGGFCFPVGMFWFAWTSSPSINPWPQIISTVPIGMGALMIFLQGLNYIIDTYKYEANSALAANSLIRSASGAAFPLFATAMFHNLGVAWATSLLGFLCVTLFPVPILFYAYGERIRRLSKFVPDM